MRSPHLQEEVLKGSQTSRQVLSGRAQSGKAEAEQFDCRELLGIYFELSAYQMLIRALQSSLLRPRRRPEMSWIHSFICCSALFSHYDP